MISPDTYEELYEILCFMDKSTVMKIPEEILNSIAENRNQNFISTIDKNDLFNKNNMREETLDVLCYIDYHYWMDKSKKIELDKLTRHEEWNKEQEKKDKYNSDLLFKKEIDNTLEHENNYKDEMILHNESIVKKIWNKLLSIFK